MLKLREIRLENQMSQRELAERLGLTAHNIGDWERGKCEPSIFFLDQIANQFGCSVDYLIGREDEFGNVSVSVDLTESQKKLLFLFNSLPEARQQTLLDMVSDMYEANKSKVSSIKNKSIS